MENLKNINVWTLTVLHLCEVQKGFILKKGRHKNNGHTVFIQGY